MNQQKDIGDTTKKQRNLRIKKSRNVNLVKQDIEVDGTDWKWNKTEVK